MGTTTQRRVAVESSGWARVSAFGFGVAPDQEPPGHYLSWLSATAPAGWNYAARHLQLIAKARQDMTDGLFDRLILEMPPRHAKTETGTIRYVVFRLLLDPTLRILVVCHTQHLAQRLGRAIRKLARQEGVRISPERSAMAEFETIQGGLVTCCGFASPPTGTGYNIIIFDDPIKSRADAESKVFRERLWEGYNDDYISRLEPSGELSVTNTRWHHDDLTGRILDSKEASSFTRIRLPALAEPDDPLGRAEGEALWPERYPVAALHRIRDGRDRDSGVSDRYSWDALYQQNPTPRTGSFFDVSKIEIVDALPAGLQFCRSWDLGNSDGGDFTAGSKIGGPCREGLWYHAGRVKGKWESSQRNKIIRQTADVIDGPSCPITVPKDPGAGGKEVATMLVKLLAGFAVEAIPVTKAQGDKENRATPLAAQVNAGNFRMLRGPWNAETIEEMRQFPNGKNDDEIDSMADAFNRRSRGRPQGEATVGVAAGTIQTM